MAKLPTEHEKAILDGPPKGTLFLILLYGLAMLAGWLYLYFVRHLGAGVVH